MSYRCLKNRVLGASLIEAPKTNNKGVSLVALVITIIVMIILAGIAMSMFFGNQDKAYAEKILEEFTQVENAIVQRGYENAIDGSVYVLVGEALTDENPQIINGKTYGRGFHLLNKGHLESLGLTGTTHEYVVNYRTGEVITTEPFFLYDTYIYTKDDIKLLETDGYVTDNAEYDEEKSVNKPILYSGMIPVKYENSSWVVTLPTDPEWYDYAADSTGGPIRAANVMTLDDLTVKDSSGRIYSNEEVRGMKLDILKGMKVVEEGSMFIWIPRYTYKEEGGIKHIVYSKLTQDYVLNGYIKEPSFYKGEYTGATAQNDNDGYQAGGKELSGKWISKYEATYVN